ncbi:MAG: hypothetical protein ACLROA_05655, partial [Turicibacter sp.]
THTLAVEDRSLRSLPGHPSFEDRLISSPMFHLEKLLFLVELFLIIYCSFHWRLSYQFFSNFFRKIKQLINFFDVIFPHSNG